MINMTRVWDKENIRVPEKNQTHDLPKNGRALHEFSWYSR